MLGRDDDDGWQVSMVDPSAKELSNFMVPWLVCENKAGTTMNCSAELLENVAGNNKDASFEWTKTPGTPTVVDRIPITKPMSDRRKCSDDNVLRDAMAQIALNLGIKIDVDEKLRPGGQHLVDQKNALAVFTAASNTDLDMILKRAAPLIPKKGEDGPAKAMVSTYPDEIVPVVRSLQAIYGMVMDVVFQNPPPFVKQSVNGFVRSAGLDQLVSTWASFANEAAASCSSRFNLGYQVAEDSQCDAGASLEGGYQAGVGLLLRQKAVQKVLNHFDPPLKGVNKDLANCRQVYSPDDCKDACLTMGPVCRGFTFWKKQTQCCFVGGQVVPKKEEMQGGVFGFGKWKHEVDCYVKEMLPLLTPAEDFHDATENVD